VKKCSSGRTVFVFGSNVSPYIRQHGISLAASSYSHEKGLLWLFRIEFGKEEQILLKHWGDHWAASANEGWPSVLEDWMLGTTSATHRLTFGQVQWVAARLSHQHHQKQRNPWEGRQKTFVACTVSTRFAWLGWELKSAAALQTSSALGGQRRWEDLRISCAFCQDSDCTDYGKIHSAKKGFFLKKKKKEEEEEEEEKKEKKEIYYQDWDFKKYDICINSARCPAPDYIVVQKRTSG